MDFSDTVCGNVTVFDFFLRQSVSILGELATLENTFTDKLSKPSKYYPK